MLTNQDIQLINETLATATPVTGKYLTSNQSADKLNDNTNAGPLEPERDKNMPYLNPGDKLNSGFSQFHKLKDVGEKLRFRIMGIPFVEGKHFFQSPEGWDVKGCVRINDGVECQFCNVYFEAIKKAKKSGDDKQVATVKDDSKMRPYKCSLIVYYPILNRNESKFEILQTTMGIRDEIESEATMGTDTTKVDFNLLVTAAPGKGRYKLSKVDSSDTPPLSAEELQEVEKGKKVKLDEIVAGSADADSEVAQQNDTVTLEV